jgi:Ca2+-binding EF-hand superfamily protein
MLFWIKSCCLCRFCFSFQYFFYSIFLPLLLCIIAVFFLLIIATVVVKYYKMIIINDIDFTFHVCYSTNMRAIVLNSYSTHLVLLTGRITFDEFVQSIESFLSTTSTESENSPKRSGEEVFESSSPTELQQRLLEQLFEECDSDNDGVISYDDIISFLPEKGFDEDLLLETLQRKGINGRKTIAFAAFQEIMGTLLEHDADDQDAVFSDPISAPLASSFSRTLPPPITPQAPSFTGETLRSLYFDVFEPYVLRNTLFI